MAETIAVLSLKGGTGKTTTVRTLADVLRRVGLDVLAIDLDPQGNLSDYFDVPPDASPTIADVLRATPRRRRPSHDGIVPASPILAEVERSLSGKMGRELVLRKALKDARKQHDVILIDCPPALGLLTINGLVAADWALISSEAQYFALQGVQGALEVIEQAKEFYNPDLEWLGVVMNIADMRTVHSREAYAQLKEHFGDKVFETVIRSSIAYAESAERALLDPRPPARPGRRLPGAGRRGPRAHRAARRRASRRSSLGARGLHCDARRRRALVACWLAGRGGGDARRRGPHGRRRARRASGGATATSRAGHARPARRRRGPAGDRAGLAPGAQVIARGLRARRCRTARSARTADGWPSPGRDDGPWLDAIRAVVKPRMSCAVLARASSCAGGPTPSSSIRSASSERR